MNKQLVTDPVKLNKLITEALNAYSSSGEKLHVGVCSALLHTLSKGNGDCSIINKIYPALRSNDQQAFKLYIRRFHICVGRKEAAITNDRLTAEEKKAASEAGTIFLLRDSMWSVKGGWKEHAEFACGLVSVMVEADVKRTGWAKFLQSNNFAEVKYLGDDDAIAAILQVANRFTGQDTETRKLQVSPFVRSKLEQLKAMAETMKEQAAGQAKSKQKAKPDSDEAVHAASNNHDKTAKLVKRATATGRSRTKAAVQEVKNEAGVTAH